MLGLTRELLAHYPNHTELIMKETLLIQADPAKGWIVLKLPKAVTEIIAPGYLDTVSGGGAGRKQNCRVRDDQILRLTQGEYDQLKEAEASGRYSKGTDFETTVMSATNGLPSLPVGVSAVRGDDSCIVRFAMSKQGKARLRELAKQAGITFQHAALRALYADHALNLKR